MCDTVYSIAVKEYLGVLVRKFQAKGKSGKFETHIDIDTLLASFCTLGDKSLCPLVDGFQRLYLHYICHGISLSEKALSFAMLQNRETGGYLANSRQHLLTSSLFKVENMVL
jgi:hypothetical protein